MRIAIRGLLISVIVMALAASGAHAGGGGPHLWLSTDPNQFNEGGAGYVSSGSGWNDESYVSNSLPFTAYLYNAAPMDKGTAYDIGLIVAVHNGDENGSITIADAFGVETTLKYTDFVATNPYPGGDHGIDGVYAILKPSQSINLTPDSARTANTTSISSSWTQFVVKSSSFADVHFDAKSFGGNNVFYNPASHDNTWDGGGNPATPEPASLSLLGLGLLGLIRMRKNKKA